MDKTQNFIDPSQQHTLTEQKCWLISDTGIMDFKFCLEIKNCPFYLGGKRLYAERGLLHVE